MRLFATGAMSWVMSKALPEDVPIEAKMVTKAIERAQNTVEGRNSEIRKDVLKYDEVMNEQRKVIYAHRLGDPRGRGPPRPDGGAARGDHRVARAGVVPERLLRGVGPRAPGGRGDAVLPDPVHHGRPGRGDQRRPDHREPGHRGPRVLRDPLGGDARRRGDGPPDRARRDAPDHRPALARPPGRDGLPARGHQPAGDGSAGPAGGLAARGVLDVRPADGRDRRRLPALRAPRRGDREPGRRARPRPGRLRGRRRPGHRHAGPGAGVAGRAGRRRSTPRWSRSRPEAPPRATAPTGGRPSPRPATSRPWCRR